MPRFRSLALLAFCGCQSASAAPTQPSPATGVLELIVANQQSASVSLWSADGPGMKHVTVGDGPHEAAVSPDGRTGVATIYGTQVPGNRLAVLDLVGDSLLRTIDLGQYTRPHGVVFLGDRSDRVAVTSEATNTVVIVDLGTGAIEPVPTQARASHMIAVTADGTRGWTANIVENSVSELDLAGRRFVRAFSVPPRPEGITVTPDGAEVWVGSNETGAVTVISTATGQTVATVAGATFPYRLAASPDGTRIAIVDGQGDQLLIADRATKRVVTRVPLAAPRGVAIAADNRTAFVTLAGAAVAEVDIVTGTMLRTLPVQASPDGVGVGVRR